MIYEVNGDLRSSMLIDGTAEARLADILTIMDSRTFPKRESEKIVGGPGRLRVLVNTQRVRVEYKSNGRSYYNASDVLSFAKVRKGKNNEKKNQKRTVREGLFFFYYAFSHSAVRVTGTVVRQSVSPSAVFAKKAEAGRRSTLSPAAFSQPAKR